ncbi:MULTISPECIES: response regulator transcription factor [Mesorhizobium]|uniref:response regulator transcription factor n=1 Tax=Mesorhizobium TaxID=68287 RepID=UPI000687A974|nr:MULTISPECIES: response regulator transcription factor [Mesorhizobium]WJI40625.1 response regulator transcription factor [Mesorhizobium opportunistum]
MVGSQRALKATRPVEPCVIVIDDDVQLRDALANLFRSVGLEVLLFGSGSEFLQAKLPEVPCCLVLDIRLPGMSGLDFQNQLLKAGIDLPIVFMTGHGDIPMSVRAMKAGAVDFLGKPFRDQDMLDAVALAIERDRERRVLQKTVALLRDRYNALTPREAEVMTHVSKGLLNKQIAAEMSLAEITVKIHRGNLMRKMGATSLAHLVRMAASLGIHGD